ncbi:MAG: phosphotransferase [Bacteroidia bacterium]|nr:phosphotransferase [Bacteroidia bacterium]
MLFKAKSLDVISIQELPPSGSYRRYFRLFTSKQTFIGAYNPDPKENLAFIHFTKHFINCGLNVPEIVAEDIDNHIYILSDLGDTTIFSYLEQNRKNAEFPESFILLYKKILNDLTQFQFNGGKDLDYSFCYPRSSFDKQSMMWDLNYFKYYFLKLAKIHFDEQKLEDDFEVFVNYLSQADSNYFLYRDFQSRNIMLDNDNIFYIDYQGGRRGPLYYDVASLLYDAKANIPQKIREELLDYYISVVNNKIPVNNKEFKGMYYCFVLIRIMQAMGAYGFRGFYEKKEHFLKSIPFALNNLDWLLENVEIPIKIPTLLNVLQSLTVSEELKKYNEKVFPESSLSINVNSFSFFKGIPEDKSGNGGGFVFDCRALPNPGRYAEYENYSGLDLKVSEFLNNDEEVKQFLQNVIKITEQSVEKYISRNFTNLQISFGCTGGQHRSVFCAEKLAAHFKSKYNIKVDIEHTNRVNWKK